MMSQSNECQKNGSVRVARFFKPRTLALNTMLLLGLFLLSKGMYMDVKAQMAQWLIAHSWDSKKDHKGAAKPWWWADTKAIATLELPRLDKRVFVMQDDSGESLAFGPGHLPNSAEVNSGGHVMIAGHRDSHFDFLEAIELGDIVSTVDANNRQKKYQVTHTYVLDTTKEELLKFEHEELTLITCYPFNSVITGGPLRYIVNAKPI